jgi:hypothetical protein
MTRYTSERRKLPPNHGWRAQPDHKILVLDRGAVRIEYPREWYLAPAEDCIKIHDRKPPADDCVLAISYHHWPVIARDLSVAELVRHAMDCSEQPFTAVEPIVEETRMDLVLAWGEGHYLDERENREARTRLCLARRGDIQALLTFAFWPADGARCNSLWGAFLASLQLGEWVADPLRGPVLA